MDPITAAINAINSLAGLVTALTQLATVERQKESDEHRKAREELAIEGFKFGTAIIKALPRPTFEDKKEGEK